MLTLAKTSLLENRLGEILAPRPEIIFAFLFGSYARGTANNLSDIDIAIYVDETHMPPPGPYGYTSDIIVELKRQLKRNVDVIIFLIRLYKLSEANRTTLALSA